MFIMDYRYVKKAVNKQKFSKSNLKELKINSQERSRRGRKM